MRHGASTMRSKIVVAALVALVGAVGGSARAQTTAPGFPPAGVGQGAEPEILVGDDDRRQVDPNRYPNTAIGFLVPRWGTHGDKCTGFLVARRFVLTVGHCLYDPAFGGKPDEVTFEPNKDGPLDHAGCTTTKRRNMFVLPGWVADPRPSSGEDLAGFFLEDCSPGILGQTGWFGMDGVEWDSRMAVRGYPEDFGGSMVGATGETYSFGSQVAWYYIDATDGESGAPVFIVRDPPGPLPRGPYALAVHAGGQEARGANYGTRLTYSRIRTIAHWIDRGLIR